MKGISVIICCYNSALRLPETVKHLALQKIPGEINWEVIVVNNNSSDETVKIAKTEWSKYNVSVPLLIVEEPILGLSDARKRGILTAKYEIIIFCDDDNWLHEDYIQTSFEIMNNYPEAGILGGDSIPVCEIPAPDWFEVNKNDYAVGKQGNKSGDSTSRKNLWGAGMVVRRDLMIYMYNIGYTSFLKGRMGTHLGAGDDNEICKLFILSGFKLWYDSRLSLKHFIPKERLNKSYWNGMWEGFNKSDYWLGRYDILIHIKNENGSRLKNFVKGLKYLLLQRTKVFVIKDIDLTKTYIQFLIGPLFKITSDEEHLMIKIFYPFLYNDFKQKRNFNY